METRTLQHTDLAVSRACFGTMTFGSQVDEPTSIRMIDSCLDTGINFIDTANVYNQGLSETIVGKALKGRRNRVILASKVRGKMGEGPDESGLSKRAMLRAIDESLKRLETDHLDLYYLHQPDYAVPIEETLETMEQLVRQGKVRYPASSNYAVAAGRERVQAQHHRVRVNRPIPRRILETAGVPRALFGGRKKAIVERRTYPANRALRRDFFAYLQAQGRCSGAFVSLNAST